MTFNFTNIQKILIPTDGSDYSTRAAEYGISIAKVHNAQIMVVYVIDKVVLDLIFKVSERDNVEQVGQISKLTERDNVEQALKQDGQRYINYVLSLAKKEGVKATPILAKGEPFEQIVHLAKDLNIDLIVIGTYGRRGAERILIGSVTERVIEYSPCPVLVIK